MANAKILVVEDESIIARDVQESLKRLGYDVPAVASSGEEAIEKAAETRPDLVLMDIVLKGDVDGVRAAEQIRARFNVPVVYLTAYADERTVHRAKTTEPFGYILKPFEDKDLGTTIEMALYKHMMESRLRESEQWLAITLKSIGDAVIVTDEKELVLYMNPVAEALTGWKQKEALGKHLIEVFHVVNEETHALTENPATKALREGVVVGLANRTLLITKDGIEIPVDDSVAPIKDDKGNITGVVLVFSDITERKRMEEKLRYMNTHDILTGLYNRTYFEEEMTRLEHSRQFPVSIIIADVDGLKATNDIHGHAAGDELLRCAAGVLRAAFRAEDVVARIGGDEFAVLLPRSDATAAEEALKRVRNGLAAHNASNNVCPLTLSMGASTVEMGHLTEALKQADERMYREKLSRSGRGS